MGQVAVTVAGGATTSGAAKIAENYEVTGFVFDSALGNTAVSFTMSIDGTNYLAVEDDASAAITITGEASKPSMLATATKANALRGLKDFKIVLGGAQGASTPTTITILTQRVC